MTDRYFSEVPILEAPISGAKVVLGGPEAHHLIHVMRVKPGAQIVLFDGSGAEFAARVERLGRAEVELAVLSHKKVDRELPVDVSLGVALPKGDRRRWLVEKAVELGVRRIVPLRTARSVSQPVETALDRLRRTVIEASKQCGRNRLMEIAQPRGWVDFVAETKASPCRLLAHPRSRRSTAEPLTSAAGSASHVLLAIGPEGGFTAEEVSPAAEAGWQLIDLGPRILHVETAAVLLVAMVTQARAV